MFDDVWVDFNFPSPLILSFFILFLVLNNSHLSRVLRGSWVGQPIVFLTPVSPPNFFYPRHPSPANMPATHAHSWGSLIYVIIPIFSGCVWLAMLLGMLLWWTVEEGSPYLAPMRRNQTIA